MQAPDPAPALARPPRRPWWRRRPWWVLVAILTPPALFAINGLALARGRTPIGSDQSVGTPPGTHDLTVRVMAWNLAKCYLHHGGLSFDSEATVRTRLRAIATVIRAERPDFVFLSEVVTECTLCPVDQLQFLREQTGLAAWAFGENYNFGLPFLRVVGGNAILSRFPIEAVANPDLAGRRPFHVTRNNRRVLFAQTLIHDRTIALGAIHTDSFDLENNRRQTEQTLQLCAQQPTLLAGDFNADPDTASIAAVVASKRFTGAVLGPGTYPSDAPTQRIDYVFAPHEWQLIEHRVIDERTSDHRPVFSVFRVKAAAGK